MLKADECEVKAEVVLQDKDSSSRSPTDEPAQTSTYSSHSPHSAYLSMSYESGRRYELWEAVMKWKLSAFREPFQAHKVGEDATELRPDMGPQRGKSGTQSGIQTAILAPERAARTTRKGARNNNQIGSTSGGRTLHLRRPFQRQHLHARPRPTRHRQGQLPQARRVRRGGSQRVLAAHVRYLGRPNATQLERHGAFFNGVQDATNVANIGNALGM